jgi:hypothetical protein
LPFGAVGVYFGTMKTVKQTKANLAYELGKLAFQISQGGFSEAADGCANLASVLGQVPTVGLSQIAVHAVVAELGMAQQWLRNETFPRWDKEVRALAALDDIVALWL